MPASSIACRARKSRKPPPGSRSKGWDALPYHAGLDAATRNANQRRFLREEGVIMVATIAFGMGIDKPNVRFVAHLDLPKSMEGYYQETGRAGRDGLPANAWMTYGLGDVVSMRQMLDSGDAPEERKRVERHKLDALLGFCESTACRHQTLLRYFGEEHPGACGNCDNCLEPVDTWDATEAAQMALSCVYRTGQRFGVVHLIDVLLGKATRKSRTIRSPATQHLRHRPGAHTRRNGAACSANWSPAACWTSTWKPTAACASPKTPARCCAANRMSGCGATPNPPRRKVSKAERGARAREAFAGANEDPLWLALKAKRTELAREQGVPPYVIFHDSTLLEILNRRPGSLTEMGQISGVGQAKLERYGDAFLQVLEDAATGSLSSPKNTRHCSRCNKPK